MVLEGLQPQLLTKLAFAPPIYTPSWYTWVWSTELPYANPACTHPPSACLFWTCCSPSSFRSAIGTPNLQRCSPNPSIAFWAFKKVDFWENFGCDSNQRHKHLGKLYTKFGLKNMIVKIGIFPNFRGENKEYLSCHHLVRGFWAVSVTKKLPFRVTLTEVAIICTEKSLSQQTAGTQTWRFGSNDFPFPLNDFLIPCEFFWGVKINGACRETETETLPRLNEHLRLTWNGSFYTSPKPISWKNMYFPADTT